MVVIPNMFGGVIFEIQFHILFDVEVPQEWKPHDLFHLWYAGDVSKLHHPLRFLHACHLKCDDQDLQKIARKKLKQLLNKATGFTPYMERISFDGLKLASNVHSFIYWNVYKIT